MRHVVVISLLLAVGGLIAPASNVRAQSARRAQSRIRAALENWTTAFNAGDSGRICDLFAPDLIADYQGQPERNYQSLCDHLRRSLSGGRRKFHYSLAIREILVSGSLAVVRLVWTLRTYQTNGAEAGSTIEPGIDIFRLQPDGSWKISRFMAYGFSAGKARR